MKIRPDSPPQTTFTTDPDYGPRIYRCSYVTDVTCQNIEVLALVEHAVNNQDSVKQYHLSYVQYHVDHTRQAVQDLCERRNLKTTWHQRITILQQTSGHDLIKINLILLFMQKRSLILHELCVEASCLKSKKNQTLTLDYIY
ncbi:uncharacterized protein LOC131885279 [Tigriopus californicus]|uniref:uncharacterized protein LOC131885279 n=1 Tax=Tigriopus californicus TaxID=6832 RepID=UPI0027DAA02C|nr:uncharacterized protein LOC131885279 [Tigriopus californicus]